MVKLIFAFIDRIISQDLFLIQVIIDIMNTESSTALTSKPEVQACLDVAYQALIDLKAKDVLQLDVSHLSNVTDAIIIASGTSTRHVKALADNVADEARKAGFRPLGMEGERDAEWILVDLNNVIVHVMLPTARKFYDLESLWQIPAAVQS